MSNPSHETKGPKLGCLEYSMTGTVTFWTDLCFALLIPKSVKRCQSDYWGKALPWSAPPTSGALGTFVPHTGCNLLRFGVGDGFSGIEYSESAW